jgi:hypothetical protein
MFLFRVSSSSFQSELLLNGVILPVLGQSPFDLSHARADANRRGGSGVGRGREPLRAFFRFAM